MKNNLREITLKDWTCFCEPLFNCISPNVGRYFGLVTGPPPPPAMEAMQAMEAAAMEAAAAAATERFRRLLSCQTQSVLQDMFFGTRFSPEGGCWQMLSALRKY